MKRWALMCAAAVVAVASVARAGIVFNLKTDELFTGDVVYNDANYDDWRVFYAAGIAPEGSVRLNRPANPIQQAVIDKAKRNVDFGVFAPITSTWTDGTPVPTYDKNQGMLTALVGSFYPEVATDGAATSLKFDVVAHQPKFDVEMYMFFWAMSTDLTVSNVATSTNLGTLSHGKDTRRLAVEVDGAEVGSTITFTFNNFSGNADWGQLGIFSANIVPLPGAAGMASMGLASVGLLARRRKAN